MGNLQAIADARRAPGRGAKAGATALCEAIMGSMMARIGGLGKWMPDREGDGMVCAEVGCGAHALASRAAVSPFLAYARDPGYIAIQRPADYARHGLPWVPWAALSGAGVLGTTATTCVLLHGALLHRRPALMDARAQGLHSRARTSRVAGTDKVDTVINCHPAIGHRQHLSRRLRPFPSPSRRTRWAGEVGGLANHLAALTRPRESRPSPTAAGVPEQPGHRRDLAARPQVANGARQGGCRGAWKRCRSSRHCYAAAPQRRRERVRAANIRRPVVSAVAGCDRQWLRLPVA